MPQLGRRGRRAVGQLVEQRGALGVAELLGHLGAGPGGVADGGRLDGPDRLEEPLGSGTVDWPGSSQAVSIAGKSGASQTTAHSRRIGASAGRLTKVVRSTSAGSSGKSAKTIVERATRASSVQRSSALR